MAITRKVRGHYVLNGVSLGQNYQTGAEYVDFAEPQLETTYVGRVFEVFRDNYQAMSDVYTVGTFAWVLGDDLKVKRVLVNANFECDVSEGRAEVDASEASLAIKRLRDIEAHNAQEKARAAELARLAEKERNRPVKGKTMKVTRGRKVAVGTVGVVAFVKDDVALLKDPAVWQDRKAQGVWVNVAYLEAV